MLGLLGVTVAWQANSLLDGILAVGLSQIAYLVQEVLFAIEQQRQDKQEEEHRKAIRTMESLDRASAA